MSALQAFLRAGGTPKDLLAKYAIKSSRHLAYSNLVMFKYNQIESPFHEPIVQQARGPILDEADNWAFVSRPFDKFFNHGEQLAAEIDWSTARVQEKLDGSLCTLYFYDGKWHVATSGTPDAGGECNGMGVTFRDLFWQVFEEQRIELPGRYNGTPMYTDLTFMFELMTPYNRVVVRHAERKIALLAIRRRETGDYIGRVPEVFPNCPDVRSFPLQTLDDIAASFAAMDPLAQEGYVVVDAASRRLKVKHPGYVALHHLRGDGFGPKRILDVIRKGETTEILANFPEWKPEFVRIQASLDEMVATIERDYAELKDIPVQKDFALRAVKTKCSAALFSLRSGKVATARQFLSEMFIGRLMELLELRDVEVSE